MAVSCSFPHEFVGWEAPQAYHLHHMAPCLKAYLDYCDRRGPNRENALQLMTIVVAILRQEL